MPIYDYRCAECGHLLETIHGIHEPGPSTCPVCGAEGLRRLPATPAIVFKGSGWAKKERRASSPSKAKSEDRDGGGGGESGSGSSDGTGSDAPARPAPAGTD